MRSYDGGRIQREQIAGHPRSSTIRHVTTSDLPSLPAGVIVERGPGGLLRLQIRTRAASAEVYPHGAHVTAWHPGHSVAPVLWMSEHSSFAPTKPIRGGVPICFPWFGPHAAHRDAPAHGFARLLEWKLGGAAELPDGGIRLWFTLAGAGLSAAWPHRFAATFTVAVGAALGLELEVQNPGEETWSFEEALHSYFRISDAERVQISGLEGCSYIDKTAGNAVRTQGASPIRFAGETDRVYLNTHAECVLEDEGLRRRIRVTKEHSASTVVWNPWTAKARSMSDFGDDEWRGMACIETANVGEAAVQLAPGGTHRMSAIVAVEAF